LPLGNSQKTYGNSRIERPDKQLSESKEFEGLHTEIDPKIIVVRQGINQIPS
jgi:hypothetical protein